MKEAMTTGPIGMMDMRTGQWIAIVGEGRDGQGFKPEEMRFDRNQIEVVPMKKMKPQMRKMAQEHRGEQKTHMMKPQMMQYGGEVVNRTQGGVNFNFGATNPADYSRPANVFLPGQTPAPGRNLQTAAGRQSAIDEFIRLNNPGYNIVYTPGQQGGSYQVGNTAYIPDTPGDRIAYGEIFSPNQQRSLELMQRASSMPGYGAFLQNLLAAEGFGGVRPGQTQAPAPAPTQTPAPAGGFEPPAPGRPTATTGTSTGGGTPLEQVGPPNAANEWRFANQAPESAAALLAMLLQKLVPTPNALNSILLQGLQPNVLDRLTGGIQAAGLAPADYWASNARYGIQGSKPSYVRR